MKILFLHTECLSILMHFTDYSLIALIGYQKENERLYEEIKMLKSEGGTSAKDKSATAAMFKENRKLLKEIGNLR